MADVKEGETIWAWVERDREGGVGIIYAYLPALGGGGTLIHRRREIVEMMRPVAQGHADATGNQVWLREYRMVADHDKL